MRHSQLSKSALNEKVNLVMCHLKELRKKVWKIVQEKKILEIELQAKQRECQLLSEMQEKDAKKDADVKALLEEKISRKQKEIEALVKGLEEKESDLQSARQEAEMQQDDLLKARAELKEKHQEVKHLKEKNEKLACSYNVRKEQISKLIQLTVTLSHDKMEMEVCTQSLASFPSLSHLLFFINRSLSVTSLSSENDTLRSASTKMEDWKPDHCDEEAGMEEQFSLTFDLQ